MTTKTNQEHLLESLDRKGLADLIQGHGKCRCCTNYYWDGGQAYCHQNGNRSSCEDGIAKWLGMLQVPGRDHYVPTGSQCLYDVPHGKYLELYHLFARLAGYNREYLGEEERQAAIFDACQDGGNPYCPYDTRMSRVYAYHKSKSHGGYPAAVLLEVLSALPILYPDGDTKGLEESIYAFIGEDPGPFLRQVRQLQDKLLQETELARFLQAYASVHPNTWEQYRNDLACKFQRDPEWARQYMEHHAPETWQPECLPKPLLSFPEGTPIADVEAFLSRQAGRFPSVS